MIALMYHCITGATGFQNFFPSLTETLGFSDTISLLLVAPPYIFMVFYSYAHATSTYMPLMRLSVCRSLTVLHALASDRFGKRWIFWMYPIPIVVVGCFLFMFTDSFGPRYFSLFLLNFAFTMNSTVSFPTQYSHDDLLTLQ